ncbi:phosphotransferase [Rubellimicrobium rubrum]|uniref:Phosphotransferase n=1 Tax=Rubellimicrobium rubrum TaxID=2585369 RepID=A0A5C4MPF5_9RHOB|nr:aminoglycoside 3'-phosphotransferase/choline kinase family protein [Rubellimicrobium rubrum]TNC47713.1 phosphotransferase [Rubellimicrobium rubrum]
MTELPNIGSRQDLARWRADPYLWRAVVQDLARAENVQTTVLASYKTGTNLVVDLDGRLILKLFPPLHRSQFESERATLRLLEGALSVPTPRIIAEGERDGWPYLIMTRLNGVLGSEAWPTLSEAEKCQVLLDVGRTIAEVQSVPPGPLLAIEPTWPEFITRQIAGCKARHASQGLAPKLLDDLDGLLAQTTTIIPLDAPPVILTGEWIPENLLLAEMDDRWHLAALIDFGDVMTGWPEYDLLGPSAFMCAGQVNRVESLLDGYGIEPRDVDRAMRRRLLTLMVLHRASDLRNVRIEGWEARISKLTELEDVIWPHEGPG